VTNGARINIILLTTFHSSPLPSWHTTCLLTTPAPSHHFSTHMAYFSPMEPISQTSCSLTFSSFFTPWPTWKLPYAPSSSFRPQVTSGPLFTLASKQWVYSTRNSRWAG
jgi:hypothetical protein